MKTYTEQEIKNKCRELDTACKEGSYSSVVELLSEDFIKDERAANFFAYPNFINYLQLAFSTAVKNKNINILHLLLDNEDVAKNLDIDVFYNLGIVAELKSITKKFLKLPNIERDLRDNPEIVMWLIHNNPEEFGFLLEIKEIGEYYHKKTAYPPADGETLEIIQEMGTTIKTAKNKEKFLTKYYKKEIGVVDFFDKSALGKYLNLVKLNKLIPGSYKSALELVKKYIKLDSNLILADNNQSIIKDLFEDCWDRLFKPEPDVAVFQQEFIRFLLEFNPECFFTCYSDKNHNTENPLVHLARASANENYKASYMPIVLKRLESIFREFIHNNKDNLTGRQLLFLLNAFFYNDSKIKDDILEILENSEPFKYKINPIAEEQIKEEIQKNHNQEYKKIRQLDLWRLFVDADKQNEEFGWYEYEKRESGTIQAIYNGWLYINETLQTEIDAQYIKDIHRICGGPGLRGGTAGEYKSDYSFSACNIYSNLSALGIKEWMQVNDQSISLRRDGIEGKFEISSSDLSNEDMDKYIENACIRYKNEVNKASSSYDKLIAMLKFIHTLGIKHPFKDSNCRTLVTLLLNKELMRHGFSPVILDNPNRFDCGYSVIELLDEVIRGWQNYQEVVLTNKLKGGHTTEEFFELIASMKTCNLMGQAYPILNLVSDETISQIDHRVYGKNKHEIIVQEKRPQGSESLKLYDNAIINDKKKAVERDSTLLKEVDTNSTVSESLKVKSNYKIN